MKTVRHWIEYAFLRTFVAIFDCLPLNWSFAVCSGLGRFLFLVARKRRSIAIENILAAGITTDREEATRIARDSFVHFSCVFLETLQAGRVFKGGDWSDRVDYEVSDELEAVFQDDSTGLILASAHYGNWEVAGQLVSMKKPIVGIARPMNNPYSERLMQKRRTQNRLRMVPKHDVDFSRFGRAIRGGEALAVMIDQRAPERQGVMIDFFGQPAPTHKAIAFLHLMTKAPLCFGYGRRTGPMRYEMRAVGPIHFEKSGDRDADVKRILDWLTQELEAVIRRDPSQYLWFHRRWRK